jgi:acetyltransferase-like isoleucine patch superfamily enzyme
MMYSEVRIHPTAEVSEEAEIGEGTSIWHQAQVRRRARLGCNCIVGKGVYIDAGVVLGDNVKVQNHVSIYQGVTLEDGVFCGPHCVFTNDKFPRAVNADGSLKAADDWDLVTTLVKRGASIGANAVIVCGVTIGEWAMVGAGAVVSRDVPDHGLVWGNPARLRGFVCSCGVRLEEADTSERQREGEAILLRCSRCRTEFEVSKIDWERIE